MQLRRTPFAILGALLASSCGARSDRGGAAQGTDTSFDSAANADVGGDSETDDVVSDSADAMNETEADSAADPNAPIATSQGWSHACALTRGGKVRCWGRDIHGTLGGTGDSPVPLPPIAALGNVRAVAAGNDVTCVRTELDEIKCWGDTACGLLGDGILPGATATLAPTLISGLPPITQVDLKSDRTVIALTADGSVLTWGNDVVGQLGYATTSACEGSAVSATPEAVPGIGSVARLAAGMEHTCVLEQDGTVECWGYDQLASLGDGTSTTETAAEIYRVTPGVVPGLAKIVELQSGLHASCARDDGGVLKCWGVAYPLMPPGTTLWEVVPTPKVIPIVGTPPFVVGAGEVCFIVSGEVQCTTLKDAAPKPVDGLPKNVVHLSMGIRRCAVTDDGDIYCWGSPPLGNGTWGAIEIPQKVVW